MKELNKPLLSICIPTFNRAELLHSALLSLIPQIKELGDEVELIVSNNCSTDHTKQVVEWAQQHIPINYNVNTENIGGARNILLITELARGEFSWILGDDDLVRIGGVKKVLKIIKQYPEIDYIFVSLSHIEYEELKKYPLPVSSKDLPDDLYPDNQIPIDRYIEKWEQLIDPSISGVFLGAIQVSVFRNTIWRKFSKNIIIEHEQQIFSSLESTYPHVKIFAHTMIGKRAYYIGSPLVIVVDGAREWLDFVPMIYLIRLNEILDLYESLGVDTKQIRRCRESLLRNSGPYIIKLLMEPKFPGREYVSFKKYFMRFWRYKALWKSLFETLRLSKKW